MTINEKLISFYRTQTATTDGAFNDLENRFFRQETGQSGPTSQLMEIYLRGLGYSGALSDMREKWIADGPPVPNPNLLAGLSWTAGANTILSVANGFARAARNGANPRIYIHAPDLFQIGATYQLGPNGIYKRNSTNVVFRISDTTAIGTDGPYDTGLLTADAVVDTTFVADATSYYFGLVGVNTLNGHYVECDEDFSVTYVSGP